MVEQRSWHTTRPVLMILILRAVMCFIAIYIYTVLSGRAYYTTQASFTTYGHADKIKSPSSIAREIPGGATHYHEIELNSGQYVSTFVNKTDLDLVMAFYDPEGSKYAEFISRHIGPLNAAIIAETSGTYRIEIHSLESDPAERHYEIRLEVRNATNEDRTYELAVRHFHQGEKLRSEWTEQSLREAIVKYADAALYWQSVGSHREAAEALERIGESHFVLSEYQQALDSYNKALIPRRALKDQPGILGVLNQIGYVHIYLGQNQKALSYLSQAKLYSNKSSDAEAVRKEAQLLNSYGEVYYSLSDTKKALDSFKHALTLWATAGDRRGEALAHLNIGYMDYDFGDLKGASEHYNRALSLWVAVNDKRGEALSRTAMGGIHSFLGEQQAALDTHNEALRLFRMIGDRQGEAATLNGIGTAYEGLNNPQAALDNYRRALTLYQTIGNRDFEALAKFYIGGVYRSMEATDQALDYYNQSLQLLRKVGNRRIETYVLRDIGRIYNSSGQTERALSQYRRVLKLYAEFEDRRGQANTLNSIGQVYHSLGNASKALGFYEQALPVSRSAEDRGGEITTLYNIACAERDIGNISKAVSRIEASIKIIEGLRTKAASPDLRASYFASVRQHYELYIDLLMNMHKQYPGKGFASSALFASELSRARSLLEMLAEAKVDIRHGADPALVERADLLERGLHAKAEFQMRVLSSKHSQDDLVEINRELRELATEYNEVQAQIRSQSSLYETLTKPKLLRLEEIQAALLDDNTLLLEYVLGEERSYLWAITSENFTSYELPARSVLEGRAREVYSLLTARQPAKEESSTEYEERVAEADARYYQQSYALSQMLLGKVVDQLGSKRLVIVDEGALQYIPFEALPTPSPSQSQQEPASVNHADNMTPLASEHEIVYLQSASMLTALRRERPVSESNRKIVVVFADPVFGQDDPRVQVEGKTKSRSETRSPESAELQQSLRAFSERDDALNVPRLLSTRQEAKMIMKAASCGTAKMAIGFEANKTTALSAESGQYQILHFATHGIIQDEHPELSCIVLSLVDEQGNDQNGFLRLSDIYKLSLDSDLVVLSACKSALGKNISGEGFIGLTRGFMYAGAKSVIASLWKVDDEATAELMSYFYHSMLKEGLTPSAALQKAKQAMRNNPKWHHPYYWAAFVLQGDYKKKINLDNTHCDSTKVVIIATMALALALAGVYIRMRRQRRRKGH